jgi:membrane-anchored protein YejM (alkaline phosphatase superfamily)
VNLLLLSIDSLRLDSVSRTSAAVSTPRFDRVAANFAFSDRCFSSSSATRPVHMSLMTGLYPFEHGIQGQHHTQVREGVPLLFELFARKGFALGAFSEAHSIFFGLDLGHPVQGLAPEPERGRHQLTSWIDRQNSASMALFVHYWSAHTPYGAADGRAMGETAQLLREGRHDIVLARYRTAVEAVFERKLAPLLEGLDANQWAVIIFGDHGESWRHDELYHGQSLRNSVLRVPLFLHFPGSGNPPLTRPLISMIDIFATIRALFDLSGEYGGFGEDMRLSGSRERYCIAEIHPSSSTGREDAATGLVSPSHILDGEAVVINTQTAGPQWSLFDSDRKYTYDEAAGRGRLEGTLSENPLHTERPDQGLEEDYRRLLTRMREASPYHGQPLRETTSRQEELLTERLRALGYLA